RGADEPFDLRAMIREMHALAGVEEEQRRAIAEHQIRKGPVPDARGVDEFCDGGHLLRGECGFACVELSLSSGQPLLDGVEFRGLLAELLHLRWFARQRRSDRAINSTPRFICAKPWHGGPDAINHFAVKIV